MVKFKEVRSVTPGERIKAENYNELALAFNQRLLAGAGDPTWRIFWCAHSLMRQVRNPSGDGIIPYAMAWPAADEWWKLYATTKPVTSCGELNNEPWSWPQAPAGEGEGANVANPMMAFEFGREPNVNMEQTVLNGNIDGDSTPGIAIAGIPSVNENIAAKTLWYDAKYQRGWIESDYPFRATAPAVERAHHHLSWKYGSFAPYLKAYSCLAPVAANEGKCPVFNDIEAVKWTLRFTPLGPGLPVLEFGTCPGEPGSAFYVSRLYDRYIVWFIDADPIVLPYTMYLEGPYAGGGNLVRPDAPVLIQSMNQFLADMRGNLAQRKDEQYEVSGSAFNYQTFLSRQYSLAPAGGGEWNGTTQQVEGDDYPTFQIGHDGGVSAIYPVPNGAELPLTVGSPDAPGTTHNIRNQVFVLGAVYVEWNGIENGGKLELYDSDMALINIGKPISVCDAAPSDISASTTIPFDAHNTATPNAKIIFLDPAINPGTVTVKVSGNASIRVGGYIKVELLEQISYKPDINDAYAVLRCALSKGDDENPDTTGDEINASVVKTFSDNYFKYGCIYNVDGKSAVAQNDYIANWNSIYEGARKLLGDNLRMVKREQVVGYDLEGGDSVLYFKRRVVGSPNSSEGRVQSDEVEVQGTNQAIKVNAAVTTTPRPSLEYLLIPKTGTDNIKPLLVSTGSSYPAPAEWAGKYPSFGYQEPNSGIYCSDFVVYANKKYVLPGYNTATLTGNTAGTNLPDDADKGYTNLLVGLPSSAVKIWDSSEGEGELSTYFVNNLTSTRTYLDALNQTRSVVTNSGKLYWVPRTSYPVGGTAYKAITTKKPTQYSNSPPLSGSGQGGDVVSDNPQDDLTFKYFNGYRYSIKRRIHNGVAWEAWETFTAPVTDSGDPSTTYSFDPGFEHTAGGGTVRGWYFINDKKAYGKTLGSQVQYEVWATPVVDYNHTNLQLLQRTYFTPKMLQWNAAAVPAGAKVRVVRTHQLYGEAEPTTAIMLASPGMTRLVDTFSSLCPLGPALATWDTVISHSVQISTNGGTTWTPIAFTGPSDIPGLVGRSNNIVPVSTGDLCGHGDASLVGGSITSDMAGSCDNRFGPSYKLYGPPDTGIKYDVPVGDGSFVEVTKNVGDIIGWYRNDTAAGHAENQERVTTGARNFANLRYIYLGADAGDDLSKRCQLFQYARSCTDGEDVIERTAGCNPTYPLSIYTYNASKAATVNSPHPVQWTPWDDLDATINIDGTVVKYYTLGTGYERLYIVENYAPPGTYVVRGNGYVEYHSTKYYSGSTIVIEADGGPYTVSSAFVRLVRPITYSCLDGSFDYFTGIAPVKDTAPSEMVAGYYYVVFGGKGIKYKVKNLDGSFTSLTKLPNPTVQWQYVDMVVDPTDYQVDPINPSQIRPVEGIRHTAPPEGRSNEWSMFLSFNHYHTSESSIWKTDAYGDQMAFLHNRCHTYSNEIKGPWNADLSKHFAYGQVPAMISEAPPGYTYLKDINRPAFAGEGVDGAPPVRSALNEGYFQSCQVYKPDTAIDSVTVIYTDLGTVNPATGYHNYDDAQIKVKLSGRLHHCAGVAVVRQKLDETPATLTGTQLSQLQNEPYRTDENALREYLHYTRTGVNCHKGALGDSSASFDLFSLPDDPFGCCHPRIYMTKHIPYVHIKSENPGQAVDVTQDTKLTVDAFLQMDFYLRAMCGGWLDITSLTGINCNATLGISPVADYLYENLCYQACRPAGALIDIKPQTLDGSFQLPIKVLSEYSFTGFPGGTGEITGEYRSREAGSCRQGDWAPLNAVLDSSGVPYIPLGGSGYSNPPTVVVDEPLHTGANAVLDVTWTDDLVNPGFIKIATVTVTSGGDGYSTPVITVTPAPYAGGTAAVLTPVLTGDVITSVTITNPGAKYAGPITLEADAAPLDNAHILIELEDPLTPSSIKRVTLLTGFTSGTYYSPPAITIIGGGGSGATLRAVLDTSVPAGDPAIIVGIEVGPTPSNSTEYLVVEHEGGTSFATDFRFTKSDGSPATPGAGVRVNQLLFPFLRENLYTIYRAPILTTGSLPNTVCHYAGLDLTLSEWDTIHGDPSPATIPGCSNNLGRTQYDDCGEACSCLWPDPATVQSDGTYVGETYMIKDDSIVDAKTFFLNWTVSGLNRYAVQRKILYKYKTDGGWVTLKENVLPPYLDSAGYPTEFEQDVTARVEWVITSHTTVTVVRGEAGTPDADNWWESDKTVTFTGVQNQRYHVQKSVVVDVNGTSTEYPGLAVDVGSDSGTSITFVDSDQYAAYGNNIQSFKYTVTAKTEATIHWNLLPNNSDLISGWATTGLSYKVYRNVSPGYTGSAVVTLGEAVIAQSSNTGPYSSTVFTLSTDELTWTGDGTWKADDIRLEGQAFRVAATWTDVKETQPVSDPADACGHLPGTTYNTDRLYRVAAIAQRRHRWFTTMPLELNINGPQGYSPLPNTCAYAEIFNNFARAVNKLVYARLELPFTKIQRSVFRYTYPPDDLEYPNAICPFTAPENTYVGTKHAVCPGVTPYVEFSEWTQTAVGAGASASRSFGATKCFPSATGTAMPVMQTTSQETQFAVDPNQECLSAIPPSLAENFDQLNGVLFVGRVTDSKYQGQVIPETNSECAERCCDHGVAADASFVTCESDSGESFAADVHCTNRLSDNNGAPLEEGIPWGRVVYNLVGQNNGECRKFLAGMFTAPGLACGDVAWVTGFESYCTYEPYFTTSSISGVRTMTYMTFPLY